MAASLDRGAHGLTPLHLEIVLWYNSRGEDMERLTAPAVSEYVTDLLNAGILCEPGEREGMRFGITEKGRFWLDSLLTVPFPTPTWTIEWQRP